MDQNRKVLLIGWDAADWRVINPLLDAGGMPNLERLINSGVMGSLSTLSPSLSPMLWTSIATGKRPFKHGICGFTEPDPENGGVRAVTNLARKTRAIWNILQLQGLTSNVVAWWPSHPAEPIQGVMVSDHYHKAVALQDKTWPMRPGTVHPPSLADLFAKLRVHPQELDLDTLRPFVPKLKEIDLKKDRRPISLAKIVAECTTVHSAATALMQSQPWDFMAVYYDAIDHFCHGFMRYHPPKMPGLAEEDFTLYQGIVEGGYRYHDMMLGTLMHLAGPDTTIVLVSDHGFHPDHLRPDHIPMMPAGPAIQHGDQGIFVMSGPGIKHDELVYGASLLDITPTILAAYGLPVGEDMDGKPLTQIFETPPALTTLASWDEVPGEDGSHPSDVAIDPVDAREALQQLVALGYVEKPDENKDLAAEKSLREMRYNEAMAYMDAGRHAEAATILVELSETMTDEYRYTVQLVACYQHMGRIEEARRELDSLCDLRIKNAQIAEKNLRTRQAELKERWEKTRAKENSDDSPHKQFKITPQERHELTRLAGESQTEPYAIELLQALQYLVEGDPEAALVYLRNAELIRPHAVEVHLRLGQAYLALKRWLASENAFRQVLTLNPKNVEAHLGLAWVLLKQRQNAQAAEVVLNALSLRFANPSGHYLLGIALHRMGHLERAIEALRVCVAQNPNHVYAHQRLEHIYGKRVGNPTAAEEHRQRAQAAQKHIASLQQGPLSFLLSPSETTLSDEEVFASPSTASIEVPCCLAETIVVVSGLPRSGTSMMMRMLKEGGLPLMTDGQRCADAHNPRGYFEYAPVMSLGKHSDWVADARGKAVKVIANLLEKMPRDKDYHYRVIFMERDLREIIASQEAMIADRKETGARLHPAELAQVFNKQLIRIRKLIGIGRFPVLYVPHRDCIGDPIGVASRVNQFLDGSLNEQAMAAAVDTGLYRHRMEGTDAAHCKA